MNRLQFILKGTQLSENSIKNTLKLLDEEATIPFISRYRKEMTQGLDEVQISAIVQYKSLFEALEKRKETILKALTAQGVLTPLIEQKIRQIDNLIQLEDLYLPYKKKRKTKASVAREQGLEVLAKIIMKQRDTAIHVTASRFLNEQIKNEEAALQGARYIIAEWINENPWVRSTLRRLYQRKARIRTQVIKTKKDEENAQKYQQYFDWEEALNRIPSHRLLALQRAAAAGYVSVKVFVDNAAAQDSIASHVIKSNTVSCSDQIIIAIADAYKRLLQPAISKECLKEAKEQADDKAIAVFAGNLKQLLLGAPLGEKRILAIDPGFKSGCKVVCLDEKGRLLHNENIYPHAPHRKTASAIKKIKSLVNAHKIEAIAIGNGTASRETEQFIKKIPFNSEVLVFIVNEAGASIYSASKLAREEFPNYDVTVRGAVSIGRRLADPLAEFVKIDPKAIGVGQYQHDVDQLKLKHTLDQVVTSTVNAIGVNVNTASKSLLCYVSGIGTQLAENIIKYRTENNGISSRSELKKIPRLGDKAFQQAAAFLRIKNSKHPLDDSAVHPERYILLEQIAKDHRVKLTGIIGDERLLSAINLDAYCTKEVGLPTLQDILKELKKPGLDPRKKANTFAFAAAVKKIDDLKEGMSIPGIVNNITNFGCFVDIGIKQSGLVHISKLSHAFVSDVNSIVKLHQHVSVKVVAVDLARGRIQLSMID